MLARPLLLLALPALLATAADAPVFEVASVKPASAGDKAPPFTITPGGSFTANTEIAFLIQIFYKTCRCACRRC